MRTDSLHLAPPALPPTAAYITEPFGKDYSPETPRVYKTKTKGAQEAHEAIRPTDITLEPEKIQSYLTPQQFKLYNLIWRRTLACQMANAIIDTLAIDVEAAKSNNVYTFRANGSQIKFDGFLKIYNGKIKENILPPLEEKEELDLIKLTPGQHFTQPPARYNEASLIKALEAEGIGRPSTYAPIISTIQERNYVQKDADRKFIPTEIGFIVNDLLVEHFPQVVDIKFTAHIEEDFDDIADGKIIWTEVLKEFYEPFKANLVQKYAEVKKQKQEPLSTDETCPQCGAPLLIRTSRFGQFYACSQYPKCRYTKNIVDPSQNLNMACPKCLEGEVVVKKTRRGKIFYGCSRWPDCDFASWDKPNGQKCPLCGQPLTENKRGLKCSNKACNFKEKSIEKFPRDAA